MNEKLSKAREYISERLELEKGLLTSDSFMEVVGDEKLTIENHKGIVKYSCNEMQIRVSFGTVCIFGKNLSVSELVCEEISVKGNIDKIEFIK